MTSTAFFLLVADMRKAQKRYFATRDSGALKLSRHYESLVDKEISLHRAPEFDFSGKL